MADTEHLSEHKNERPVWNHLAGPTRMPEFASGAQCTDKPDTFSPLSIIEIRTGKLHPKLAGYKTVIQGLVAERLNRHPLRERGAKVQCLLRVQTVSNESPPTPTA